jgi:hypothetical protein
LVSHRDGGVDRDFVGRPFRSLARFVDPISPHTRTMLLEIKFLEKDREFVSSYASSAGLWEIDQPCPVGKLFRYVKFEVNHSSKSGLGSAKQWSVQGEPPLPATIVSLKFRVQSPSLTGFNYGALLGRTGTSTSLSGHRLPTLQTPITRP